MRKIRPRSDKNAKGEQLFRCPFPDCGQVFAKEPDKPEVCLRHRVLIADVIFIMNRVSGKPDVDEAEESGPVLFVPKLGMENQAIQEALKKSKGGK